MSNTKLTTKDFFNKVLAGLSVGIVVSLIPNALFGELLKALIPTMPALQSVYNITVLAMRLMPIIIGICIALQFSLTPIQIASVGTAALIGSGVATAVEGGAFMFAGTGDTINTAITAALAVGLVLLLGNKLKAYTILLIPSIIAIVAGGVGLITLPYVKSVTTFIGTIVANCINIQPVLMGVIIAVIFAILIVSPFSTVAVATAISLAGVGSGAANLGVVAAGFGLAVCGWKTNSFGTSIAHFLGSPKMQMGNIIKKPTTMVPILCNAAILGAIAGILNIPGTPLSAGFGISGLIGPINALNLMEGGYNFINIAIVVAIFVIIPVALAILFNFIFSKKVKLVKAEDYKLEY